ncbi:uncharacterized protein LOC144167337 [Haemaphysalis longicornis]
MEYMYGLLDKDDDGDLDCSTAIRTEINEEEQTATYLWVLWGPDGQPMPLSFNYKVIPGSDQATFTIGDGDGLGKTATFLYDDHNGCAVAVLPLFGRPDCVMGVSEEVKTHVPQSCITAFEENCHTKVRGFDKDTCSGWYDDEEIARSHGSI